MISETTLYRDWFCEPRSPLCSRSLSTFFTASLIALYRKYPADRRCFPGRRRHLCARHHAAFFFCNTDRYRRLRPVFDASRSKGSGKSKKSPWYKLFHAARFFRCTYHFVSIAESSVSSMVRCKQNNISLRQYLHDDLYTRHVLRPAVHGHELFHHRAGISGAWDGNNLDRCGCQHRTGSRIYLSAAYEYCRCCSRYRPRAVVFLCFCPADAETEKKCPFP